MKSGQSHHFNKIAKQYYDHYGDILTEKYRHEIINKKLFNNLNLNNLDVLDLGCGSGQVSVYLKKIYPQIRLYGADISKNNLKYYPFKKTVLDIRKKYLKKKFHVVISYGLLHHVARSLEISLKNISKMVKKGGLFIFVEPNSQYILNPIRKLWYNVDPYFEPNEEAAFSCKTITKLSRQSFRVAKIFYYGGLGWLLINNSMIFRLNKKIKYIIFWPLTVLDKIFAFFPSFFLAGYAGILKKK
jgi:2-polyprenyl-3-methyl-5-hydroxy-6-metoxy-1,4-benzoquinol methylase